MQVFSLRPASDKPFYERVRGRADGFLQFHEILGLPPGKVGGHVLRAELMRNFAKKSKRIRNAAWVAP